jgi:hypothetical protein
MINCTIIALAAKKMFVGAKNTPVFGVCAGPPLKEARGSLIQKDAGGVQHKIPALEKLRAATKK